MTGAGVSTNDESAYRSPSRGWVRVFSRVAGVVLLVVAAFEVLQALAALADDELLVAEAGYVYELDLTVWGWIHLVIGLLLAVVALGILALRSWALVSGMIVAGLSMLANFAFLPFYPFWSLTVIAFNVVAVWALCHQLNEAE